MVYVVELAPNFSSDPEVARVSPGARALLIAGLQYAAMLGTTNGAIEYEAPEAVAEWANIPYFMHYEVELFHHGLWTCFDNVYIEPFWRRPDPPFRIKRYRPGGQEGRYTSEYRRWKRAVLERDGYCAQCGSDRDLRAHHIKPYSTHPELRYAIDNGIVLCDECHETVHWADRYR